MDVKATAGIGSVITDDCFVSSQVTLATDAFVVNSSLFVEAMLLVVASQITLAGTRLMFLAKLGANF